MKQGLMVDVDRAFGIRWAVWGKLCVASWLAMFVLAWLTTMLMWMGLESGLLVAALGLGGLVLGNVLPGIAALASRPVREALLDLEVAAALALLAGTSLIGMFGTAGLCLASGEALRMTAAAIAIGVMAFPLTFGLGFPLAIPLICAVVLWNDVRSRGTTTRRMFTVLCVTASAGWLGVGAVGLLLGKA